MNNSFWGFAYPRWLFPPPPLLSNGVADNHRTREGKRKLVATFAFHCFGIRILCILISGLPCEMQVGVQCVPPSLSHKTLSFCVYLTNNFCILWNNAMLPVIKSKSLRQSFKCNLEVIGTHQNVKIFFFPTAKLLNSPEEWTRMVLREADSEIQKHLPWNVPEYNCDHIYALLLLRCRVHQWLRSLKVLEEMMKTK